MKRRTTAILSISTALTALLVSGAVMSAGCGSACTDDFCWGPLNILVDKTLIPTDARVGVVVNGTALNCTTDYSESSPCCILGANESFYRDDIVHVEVKSRPKTVTVQILGPDNQVIASYDESPEYQTGNVNSCNAACRKSAMLTIGDVD